MANEPDPPQPFSLKRWSQRKREAARAESPASMAAPPAPRATAEVPATAAASPEPAPLPPVDTLTFDSDFAAFMQPKVNEETRRAALKKLFTDPSFNVMDGLDIYTGDYTQSDPMPAGMLEKLSAVYAMLDPVAPPDPDGDGLDAATAAGAVPASPVAVPAQGPSEEPVPQTAGAASPDDANKPA